MILCVNGLDYLLEPGGTCSLSSLVQDPVFYTHAHESEFVQAVYPEKKLKK